MAARSPSDLPIYVDENSPHWELKRAIRDTAIAVENLLLEADAQGLGTCWVGFFVQYEIRPILGIPNNKFVLGVIPIGYPAEQPAARPRKPLSEIVRYEKW
jgi:nitroreductase